MKEFREALAKVQPTNAEGRRWIYVAYDQLSDAVGPLAEQPPETLGIVMVESADKGGRRPYHKQKLLWVLANGRHFALEQAARGVAVDVRAGPAPIADQLRAAIADHGPLEVRRPAEYELRHELAPLFEDGGLVEIPHGGWLTHDSDFDALGSPPWRMDAFYRRVRKRTGLLMEGGKPIGGRYSFDGDNRKPWSGDPVAPTPPTFEVDPITAEAAEWIATRFVDHPGQLTPDSVPTTQSDATAVWEWAKATCMTHFGPYEDAMSVQSRNVFHTRLSPLLNVGRLLAQPVLDDVLALDIPMSSKEGFIRQLIGWREFVRHVHERTEGLTALPDGFRRRHLGDGNALPPAFWGQAPSGLFCLDHVVEGVWEEGYSHHITRLMVLSNLATLLDYSAEELSDWFWVAYVDAYDWVVQPNVLGMGTFSLGDLMTTKPYVSGSAYIDKMSDFCASCRFHPKKTCPITHLYWSFLSRNAEILGEVDRMKLVMGSLRRRSPAKLKIDADTLSWVQQTLAKGETLDPEDRPR
ncbi:MAG: cryptochrome/photolyase family protein [Myxococcota bacterium]